jgi:phosphoribosyl 1,2-cyclic phosphodiesterase
VRLHSLGSGSSGNAFILEQGDTSLLIDCGVGARVLRKALQDLDLIGRLSGVLISHEHSDHIRSLPSLRRYESAPVFATEGTMRHIGRESGWRTLKSLQALRVGELEVTPISVSHDAEEPCGFVVRAGTQTAAIFTDLGIPNADVFDALTEADVIILEANYCEAMLRASPYPPFLKSRIRGPAGHLSNHDCATMLVSAVSPRTRSIWLAHLSENNNAPDVAVDTVNEALFVNDVSLPVTALPRFERLEISFDRSTHASFQERLFG